MHVGSLTLSGQGLFSGRRFQKGSRLGCSQFREVTASDSEQSPSSPGQEQEGEKVDDLGGLQFISFTVGYFLMPINKKESESLTVPGPGISPW